MRNAREREREREGGWFIWQVPDLEVDAVDLSAGRLEALVGVLCGDARGDDVLGVLGGGLEVGEVELAHAVVVLVVETAHLGDVIERDAHGDVELRKGEQG